MMGYRTFTRTALGIGLVACVLGAVPAEALARGGGYGGFRAAPVFHRAAPLRTLPLRTEPIVTAPNHAGHLISRFAHRRAHGLTGFPFRHSVFGHDHHRRGNYNYGGYGDLGPGYGYPAAAYDDPTAHLSAPACRTQEYVVPSEDGEDRTVRVLRC